MISDLALPHQSGTGTRSSAEAKDYSAASPVLVGVGVVLVGVRIPLPGTNNLAASGLLLLALVMWPVIGRWVMMRRENRRLALLIIAWYFGSVVSNLASDLSLSRSLLNALTFPALLAVGAFAVSRLAYGSPSRVGRVLLLVTGGYCCFLMAFPTSNFREDPWKYGLAIPLTVAVGIVVGWLRQNGLGWLSYVVVSALAVVHLMLGFRSLAAICLAWMAFLLARRPERTFTLLRTSLFVVAALAAMWISVVGYSAAASRGWMGQQELVKYKYQSQVASGYLDAGRPQLLVSAVLIADRPLLGRGTAVSPSVQERQAVLARLHENGIVGSPSQQVYLFENGLNSHSLALGFWVRGGILAILPWAYFLAVIYRRVIRRWDPQEAALYPACLFMALLATWDFLFSPWSPGYEILLGIAWSLAVGVERIGDQRLQGH